MNLAEGPCRGVLLSQQWLQAQQKPTESALNKRENLSSALSGEHIHLLEWNRREEEENKMILIAPISQAFTSGPVTDNTVPLPRIPRHRN